MKLGAKLALGGGLLLLARSAFASGKASATPASSQLDFVSALWAAIARVWPSSSGASRALIISLGALESGWGKSTAFRLGNNPWNIVKGSANVPAIEAGDQECDAAGNCRDIRQKFRAYTSLDDSIRDLLALLNSSRYMSAYTLLRVGDVGFAAALGNAGYYTLPVDTYVRNFKGVLAGVQKRLGVLQLSA